MIAILNRIYLILDFTINYGCFVVSGMNKDLTLVNQFFKGVFSMSFKLKTLLAVLALSAVTAANAATTYGVTPSSAELGSGANGSSLIFSAWDDATGKGYSIDLGYSLNAIIGADPLASGSTGTATNSIVASGVTYSGSALSIALPDWNLNAGSWNLAAADTAGRYRMLVTNSNAAWAGAVNSQIKTAGNDLNNYLDLGAALSKTAGTLSSTVTADAWYAGSTSWGDNLGTSGFAGSSVDLSSIANLFVVYQKSITSGTNAGLLGGVASLNNGNGDLFNAYLSNVGGIEYLNIAAVPEADTSGMMIVGLGLMGFIARRRNAKNA